MSQIVQIFEEPTYSDENMAQSMKVVELMQEVRAGRLTHRQVFSPLSRRCRTTAHHPQRSWVPCRQDSTWVPTGCQNWEAIARSYEPSLPLLHFTGARTLYDWDSCSRKFRHASFLPDCDVEAAAACSASLSPGE